MNDPDATRADEIRGADLRMGEYVVLETAPPGTDGVTGQVWVAQDESGTTVTTELSGLEPGADYMMHLHEQTCGVDAGGEHFRFDPAGSRTAVPAPATRSRRGRRRSGWSSRGSTPTWSTRWCCSTSRTARWRPARP